MLTMLRQHAQSWIIKVVLGFIILTFIFVFGVGQFGNSKQVLAIVGSEEILVRQFQQTYQQELDKLRRQFPENADQIAQQQNLRGRVFESIVNRSLIRAAAAERGLLVTDREVSDTITALAVFQANQRFDPGLYRRILSQNRRSAQVFEAETREDLLIGKYQRSLLAGLVVSNEEVRQRYRVENEQVEVEFFLFDPKSFLPQSQSDPAAEKAYYEAHPAEFTRPAQSKVSFFVLPLGAVESQVTVREKALERHYTRFREQQYTTPKQVRASHILKKLPAKPTKEQEAAAQAEMDEVLARLRKGGDFAELARKHSEDPSKNKGGDLGFFKAEDMLSEFSRAAFALKEGETSGVVRSAFGLHVIRVTDIKPAVVKTFAAVRPEIEKLLQTRRAERSLELEAGRLPARIAKEGIGLVAAGWSLKPRDTGWLDQGATVEGLGPAGELYAAARTRKQGQGGVWKRNPLQGHVFFQVKEERPSLVLPLEEVRKKATGKVKEQRAAEAANEAARAAAKTIATRQDFVALAAKWGFPVRDTQFTVLTRVLPEVGFNPDFRAAGLGLSKEKPVAVSVNGSTGHVMFLKRRFYRQPEQEAEAKKQIAVRLEQEWAEYFFAREIERLKKAKGVKVISPELVTSR